MAVIDSGVYSKLWQHWNNVLPSDAVALITPTHPYTWSSLTKQIDNYASCLSRQGVVSRNTITVVGKNSAESVFVFLAALSLGARVAFVAPQPISQLCLKLNTLYSADETSFLISLSDTVDGNELEAIVPNVQIVTLDRSISQKRPEFRYQPDEIASFIFTSGSTGTPKAVAHTSSQHLSSAAGLLDVFTYVGSDCWLLSLPVYHVSGLSILYRWLLSGATLKVGRGDLDTDIEGVTHASLVATQLQRLLDSGKPLNLTHVLLGGSDIPHKLSDAAAALGIETWVGYGMTEAASTVTAKRVDGLQGVGSVLANRKLTIENGRIFIGGDTLGCGYFRQGELFAFTNEQGWFDSKDLGEIKNEQLVICGRVDNQFISGGENIHCEEIEAALLKHPCVQQVVVIPVVDNVFGARSVAVIKTSKDLSLEDYQQWLVDKLEKFKWPINYLPLPQQALGSGIKISRPVIKAWLTEAYPHYTVKL
ncbi:o-succinylbenzoate--CoA ligase [Vibrio sp.]|nr:o-succinylbenzoate--CoA ligase [Vibrio sp.]